MRGGLALLALASGCGRIAFDPTLAADAADAACTFGPWGAPVELTALNTVANDYGPTLRADGLELFWHSQRGGGPGMDDIYHAQRTSTADPFGAASLVPNLSSPEEDENVTITRAGTTVFFTSTRTNAGYLLYRAVRPTVNDPFGTPTVVPELTTTQVWGPTLSPDETELFFTINIPNGDLAVATFDGTTFSQVRPVTELITAMTEGYPALSPDGLEIYYDGIRPGDLDTHLYMATRPAKGMPFGNEVRVTAFASADAESDPDVSSDGLSFYFTSSRPGTGQYDLYVSTRTCE